LYNVTIQQQLLSRVSVTAGYFYRRYQNFVWTNDLLTDFDSYTTVDIADPLNVGETRTVYNLKPQFNGLVQNVDQNTPTDTNRYQGYEIGVSARFGRGGTLLAGLASGRTRNQACDVEDPNRLRFCDQTAFDMPWLTQGKISGSYPLPWDISASMVFQSLPGTPRTVTYTVTRAVVPTLTLSSVSATLSKPGTLYTDRLNQVDLKFSKAIHYRRTKIVPEVGIFNAGNVATVLSQNNAYGPLLNNVQSVWTVV
jgi:hypothetical protein